MSDSAFIHKEMFWMLAGERLGYGMSRSVYACRTAPDFVIKVEEDGKRFQNVIEWETWQDVKDTPFARWFAPCIEISACGGVLVMARTERPGPDQFPRLMPAFLTDFKRPNYGVYQGRIVCHDYGTNMLMIHGMTRRMKLAKWWD